MTLPLVPVVLAPDHCATGMSPRPRTGMLLSTRTVTSNTVAPLWAEPDSSALYRGDCLELMETIPESAGTRLPGRGHRSPPTAGYATHRFRNDRIKALGEQQASARCTVHGPAGHDQRRSTTEPTPVRPAPDRGDHTFQIAVMRLDRLLPPLRVTRIRRIGANRLRD